MAKLSVFLSSTSRDLEDYRAAVYAALEGPDQHCVRMEDFGAQDRESDDFCRARVAECDVFVGILGHCYGSCPKDSKQSFSEREYEAAVAAKKSRLMFLAVSDLGVPADVIETDEAREKQRAFRTRVSDESVRDTFVSPDDLATRVVKAVGNWRVQQATAPVAGGPPRGRLLIPLPPQPYFAHPYPLQDHFTGRRVERRMLTDWLAHGEKSIFAFVALGGFGKSSLTWAWVQRDVLGFPLPGLAEDPRDSECRLPGDRRPEGVLWWSFYERDARFDAFAREALVYCSHGEVDPEALGSTHKAVVALLSRLQERRFLLVLDGFERELRAYGSLDASYQGDEVGKDTYGDHRVCIDPRASDFLRGIAALHLQSRVLLTTRLFPKDLADPAGAPLPACRREALTALDPEDAVAFLHAQGVKGTHAEIEAVCTGFGFHPLALRLLAGMVLNDPKQPGDIRAAEGYDPCPDLVVREHHILALSLRCPGLPNACGSQPASGLPWARGLRGGEGGHLFQEGENAEGRAARARRARPPVLRPRRGPL